MRDRSLEEGPHLPQPLPVVGVLDNLRSAFNVGSIFRTSEAARVGGLRLVGITPYPPNVKLDRTALGTGFRVPWRHHVEMGEALDQLQSENYHIWAVEIAPGAASLHQVRIPHNVAFVFGHEVSGVGDVARARAERLVSVPMYGRKNSLNVATTYGIVVYEALRQWGY